MRTLASGVRAMRGIMCSVVIALLVVAGYPVSASIPPPPPDAVACDFVTGGGFIVGTGTPLPNEEPSSLATGAKANFAVAGGVKNGAFWGHLEYGDHSMSPPMQAHGTSATGYAFGPAPTTASPAGAASVSCWPVKRASLPTRTAGNVGGHFGAPHVHRRPVHEQVTRAGRGGHRRRRAHLVRHRPQVIGVLAVAVVDRAEL